MNSTDFVNWLRGFLQASGPITPEHEAMIREKLSIVSDYNPYTWPYAIPCCPTDILNCCNSCPAGGEHEYPDIWHGVIPPSCRKCGKQADGMSVIC